MARNRRHLPNQDTPSATPTNETVADPEARFQMTVVNLKSRFPRGYQPTQQERLALAKDLQKAAKELFEIKAHALLPGRPMSSIPRVLKHLIEHTATRATKAWNELGRKFQLVCVIRDPPNDVLGAKRLDRVKATYHRSTPSISRNACARSSRL